MAQKPMKLHNHTKINDHYTDHAKGSRIQTKVPEKHDATIINSSPCT